ncbi:MAG: hypothetical protein M3458_04745 [Acidobacteriota bacterium]|nr:hypothetical protein [Acidobacteriota bacterium]
MLSTYHWPRCGKHASLHPSRPCHSSLDGSGSVRRQRRSFSTSKMWRARAVVFALVFCVALAGLAPTVRASETVVGASGLATATATQSGTITFRSMTTAETVTAAASITVSRPANTQSGDVMMATIFVRGAGTMPVVTAPAGWTLIRRDDASSGVISSMLSYYRVAAAGDLATYTWSFDTTRSAVGSICSYSGVNASAPIDAHSG